MFAAHYALTGDGLAAARQAGVLNPQYEIDGWVKHLLARKDVKAMIAEEAASLDAPKSCTQNGLQVITVGSLAGIEPPERPWIIPDWLPARAVTYIAGYGGTGKSLMIQQLESCISVGAPFMGLRGVRPVRCLYVNCEDEFGELHRRQVAIAKAVDRRLQTFGEDMQILARVGAADNTLGTFDHDTGRFLPSDFFETLSAHCINHSVRVVALDNVAHLYGSNENIRGEVTAFLNLLSRLALEIDGAVILVGHPAKGEGSQYSGSTAWENGVRNRLYLSRPADDDGSATENHRILSREKANLASIGDHISMVWHEGAFYPLTAVEATSGREALEEVIFLACLDAAESQLRNASHATGSNHAPTMFSKMPQAQGIGKKRLAAAMERLLNDGTILANQPLWRSSTGRRQVFGLARAARVVGK